MRQMVKALVVMFLLMFGNPVARVVFRPAYTLFRDFASFLSFTGQVSI